MKFIRVNAKEGVNINYLFEVMANFIIEKTIAKKIQFAKSKTNNLLLTYFNKLSLIVIQRLQKKIRYK